jgi:hypothetical protein
MSHKIILVALSLYILGLVTSCNTKTSDVANANFTSSPSAPKKITIKIKAAIVYKMGGPQPVARVTFHLLDDSLEQIVIGPKALAVGNDAPAEKREEFLALNKRLAASLYGYALAKGGGDAHEMLQKIDAHTVKTVTTDFDGTASFEDVPSGRFFIVGATETRGGAAVWNVQVDVSGDQTVILDQNNATIAS